MPDEVIEELWRVKDYMARECGYDVARLIADLQAKEVQEGGHRIVDLHALRNAGKRPVARPSVHSKEGVLRL